MIEHMKFLRRELERLRPGTIVMSKGVVKGVHVPGFHQGGLIPGKGFSVSGTVFRENKLDQVIETMENSDDDVQD